MRFCQKGKRYGISRRPYVVFVTIQASLLVKKAKEILSTTKNECRSIDIEPRFYIYGRGFSKAPYF